MTSRSASAMKVSDILANLHLSDKLLEGEVRPNVLLPNDQKFNTSRSDEQESAFDDFLHAVKKKKKDLLIIELGINPKGTVLDLLGEKIKKYRKS